MYFYRYAEEHVCDFLFLDPDTLLYLLYITQHQNPLKKDILSESVKIYYNTIL